jgi:hypothetical protein
MHAWPVGPGPGIGRGWQYARNVSPDPVRPPYPSWPASAETLLAVLAWRVLMTDLRRLAGRVGGGAYHPCTL